MGAPPASQPELIYRASESFHASLDVGLVLARVVEGTTTALGAALGLLALYRDENELQLGASRGFAQGSDSPGYRAVWEGAERAARERHPVLLEGRSEGSTGAVDERASLAILGAPLESQGHLLGAICVANPHHASPWTRSDLDLLTALAEPAAAAIGNALHAQKLQEQLSGLRLIHDISADLTSTLDLDTVLVATLQRVRQLLGLATASILMVEGEELVFQVAIGEKAEQVKPFRVPLSRGLAGWVVRNCEATFSNDVRHDPRFYSDVDAGTGFTTLALLAAPLIVNDRAIGVIEGSNKPGGFSDRDLELVSTIASASAIAIENARLYKLAVEKGRLERELQMAYEVQAGLLPRTTPKWPGWEFAALWEPARVVAGDFYDFVVQDDRQGILIADVADKGMAAALFMALTRSTVRANLLTGCPLAECFQQANRILSADATGGEFVTLCYVQLDPVTGDLRYVNAGHNPPLLYHAAGGNLVEFERTGLPLGIDETSHFESKALHMDAGDVLVLYTDGVTEAENPRGEMLGTEPLRKWIQTQPEGSPAKLLSIFKQRLHAFVGDATQYDDITLVIVRRASA